MTDTAASTGKICGCEQATFVKIVNMIVGISMCVIGVLNVFKVFGILASNWSYIILELGFVFY